MEEREGEGETQREPLVGNLHQFGGDLFLPSETSYLILFKLKKNEIHQRLSSAPSMPLRSAAGVRGH